MAAIPFIMAILHQTERIVQYLTLYFYAIKLLESICRVYRADEVALFAQLTYICNFYLCIKFEK